MKKRGQDMHWTLEPKRCASLAVVWLGVAVILAWLNWPFSILPVSIGVVAGVVVGVLQARSIVMAPTAFLEATTALAVRRALTSTRPGRLALTVQWVTLGPLVAVGLLAVAWNHGAMNPVLAVLGGYLSLMAVRDFVSLRGLRLLDPHPPGAPPVQ